MVEVISTVVPRRGGTFPVVNAEHLGGEFVKTLDDAGAATTQDIQRQEVPVQVPIDRGSAIWLGLPTYDPANHTVTFIASHTLPGAPVQGDILLMLGTLAITQDLSGAPMQFTIGNLTGEILDVGGTAAAANFIGLGKLYALLWDHNNDFRMIEPLPTFYEPRFYARYGVALQSVTNTPTEAEILAGATSMTEVLTFGDQSVPDQTPLTVWLFDRRSNINYINNQGGFPENQRRFFGDPVEVMVSGFAYYGYRGQSQTFARSLENRVYTLRVELPK